jgi:DNA mismatch endonuclease, patch repair protein
MQMMRRFKKTDTRAEVAVRTVARRLGFSYKTYSALLPGKPDLVFHSKRKVIFVHGCFWHQHAGCRFSRMPKRNLEYWEPKLQGNKRRDAMNKRRLRQLGWSYLVIWECRTSKPELAKLVSRFLDDSPQLQRFPTP